MSSSPTSISTESSRVKHPKLWFPDGDLVLSAPISPEKQRVYRIHRFIVMHNSPVLCERLGEQRTNAESELAVPDNAELIDILLTFLYNPLYLPFKHLDPKNPLLFHKLLSLCTTYGITTMRIRIIHFLEQEWPNSLSLWDERESHLFALANQHLPPGPGGIHDGPYLDDLLPEPASVVRLSRIHNIPSILPVALFELSRIDRGVDYMKLHAHPHRQSIQSVNMLSIGVRSALWHILSNEDHMCIHRGQDAMQRLLLQFFERASGLCPLLTCIHGRMQLRTQVWAESIKRRDILSALQSFGNGHWMVAHGVCSQCTLHIMEAITKMRLVIFHNLGNLFGVVGGP